MIRKSICTLWCMLLLITFAYIPQPLAALGKAEYGTITIDTITAAAGDTVIVPLRIENNPGIMAITISVTYDKDALTYEKYIRGYLSDYTVADHPNKSLIRFVNCETHNRDDNGIMVSFQFTVNENVSAGLHPISIDYSIGDFADWEHNKLEPVIVSGGVKVPYNGSNCSHTAYGSWQVVAPAGCLTPGAKQRSCKTCGHTQIQDTAPVGHTYEKNWTVDRVATKTQSGTMSRHCLHCDAYTDLLAFSLKDCEKGKITNKEKALIKKTAYIEKMIKAQLPEETPESEKSKPSEAGKTSDTKTTAKKDEKKPGKDKKTDTEKQPGESAEAGITEAEKTPAEVKVQEAVSAAESFLELVPDLKTFLLFAAAFLSLFLKFIFF